MNIILSLILTHSTSFSNSFYLSVSVSRRALFHVDNAYHIPNLRAVGKICKTNVASNTAFRYGYVMQPIGRSI